MHATAMTIDGKRYDERTPADWQALPVVDCDDCISTDDARWPAYFELTRAPKDTREEL